MRFTMNWTSPLSYFHVIELDSYAHNLSFIILLMADLSLRLMTTDVSIGISIAIFVWPFSYGHARRSLDDIDSSILVGNILRRRGRMHVQSLNDFANLFPHCQAQMRYINIVNTRFYKSRG